MGKVAFREADVLPERKIIVALKRLEPRCHAIKNDPDRPTVTLFIIGLASDDFGSDGVLGPAQSVHAFARLAVRGQAKVDHLYVERVSDDYVFKFEVAVHNVVRTAGAGVEGIDAWVREALCARRCQRTNKSEREGANLLQVFDGQHNLFENVMRFELVHARGTNQYVVQLCASNEFHRQRDIPRIRLAAADPPHDVCVPHRHEQPDLDPDRGKVHGHTWCRNLWNKLQGNPLHCLHVGSGMDDSENPAAELATEKVPPDKRLALPIRL